MAALHAQGIIDYHEPDGVFRATVNPETGKPSFAINCSAEVPACFPRQPYTKS